VGKQNIGQLRIVDFENPQMLQKDHESLFSALPGARMVEGPGKATTVRQGSLEESNVEGIEEMVAMIEIRAGAMRPIRSLSRRRMDNGKDHGSREAVSRFTNGGNHEQGFANGGDRDVCPTIEC